MINKKLQVTHLLQNCKTIVDYHLVALEKEKSYRECFNHNIKTAINYLEQVVKIKK